MLDVKSLTVDYGRHRALDGVSITTSPGEIVVILGANGAGKTTLLKAIGGLVPCSGQITMDNQPVSGLASHQIVETGLALVPEGRGIFGELSVHENLKLGAHARRARRDESANLNRVFGLFPKLSERRSQLARTMSGGEQQMVAIGRALMSSPSVLMLDEPSLGLSPLLCSDLFKALQAVREAGVGVLLVEQNARQSLAIADRAYLLENGSIVGEGSASELANDPAVQRAYLGGAAGDASPGRGAPQKTRSVETAGARQTNTTDDVVANALASLSRQRLAITPSRDGAVSNDAIRAMIDRAESRQREHIDTSRPASAAASTGLSVGNGASQSLESTLASIEAAAASALQSPRGRTPRIHIVTPDPVPERETAKPPNSDSAMHPTIEIYRRSKPGGPLERAN